MRKDIQNAARTIAGVAPALISGAELDFFSKAHITNCQFIAIMAIFHAKRCTVSALAESLHVAMPTVTGLVDRLVKMKLATRVSSQKDRRKVFIELSPKGMSLISDFKGMVCRRWTRLLDTLSPADVKTFKKLFEELRGNMENQKNEKKS